MKEYFFEIFKKNSKEINNLYGIRAISCYLVILFHCFAFSVDSFPSAYASYLHNAQNVEFLMSIFFVISAFLVSASFSRELERENFLDSWKKFVIKRSLRIFPAFYVILSITIIVMASIVKKSQILGESDALTYGIIDLKIKLSYWWTDFAYISNYFPKRILVHGWSLSMEEQFYLAMPIAFIIYLKVLTGRKQKFIFLIFLLVLPVLIRYLYYLNDPIEVFDIYVQRIFHPIHTHFEPFVYGVFLMELWKSGKVSLEFVSVRRYYAIFSIMLIVFGYVCTLEFSQAKLFFIVYRISFYSIFAFVIVFGAVGGFFSKIGWFLANPFLVFVGKLSYGIYLVHMLVNTIVMLAVLDHKHIENNDLFSLIKASFISLFFSSLIALISYIFIEKPFLKIREWVQPRFDISTNSFYFVKVNLRERFLVSGILTLLSFLPYLLFNQMIAIEFVRDGFVSWVVLWLLLFVPIVLNGYTLVRFRMLFFQYYTSRFSS